MASGWPQLELDQNLLAMIHIEAMRRGMEPDGFLRRVMTEWADATYVGVPVPRSEGYSGTIQSHRNLGN